jgi:hypothetical protein
MAIVIALLAFVVLMYAIFSQYDFTLTGKAGWFSFFFQAQDRKSRIRKELAPQKKRPVVVQALVTQSDKELP